MKISPYLWLSQKIFRKLHLGYLAYSVIPTKDAVTFLVNERLLNNLPRYKNQVVTLRNSKVLEVTHLGVTLAFRLSMREVTLEIWNGSKPQEGHETQEKLPLLPWKRKPQLMRFMAAQEVIIWP